MGMSIFTRYEQGFPFKFIVGSLETQTRKRQVSKYLEQPETYFQLLIFLITLPGSIL